MIAAINCREKDLTELLEELDQILEEAIKIALEWFIEIK